MRVPGLLERVVLGSLLLSAAGCECGSPGGSEDAGATDAFRLRADAWADDSPSPDDAAMLAPRDPERCRVEPGDVFLLGTDDDVTASERVIDVAPGADEHAAVWRETIDGFAQIRLARIPSVSGTPDALTVTEGAAVHDAPAVARIPGGYLVAWMDNATGDFEISARPALSAGLGASVRLTTREGRDDSPVLVTMGEGALAAWVETRATDPARVAVARSLSASGEPLSTQQEPITSASLGRLAIGPREGGAAILYGEGGTTPSARLQRVGSDGAAMGASELLSTEGAAAGDVDVGLTARDGAAVFTAIVEGVRRDVRVRLLDGTGTPGMSEFALNDGVEQGDSPSVARLREATGWSEGCRDGYAVVYRSYPGPGAAPVLRLVLLDAGAHVVRALDLSPTDVSARGGRTTLRIAGDGQLLVAWTDAHADRVDMRAARIRCD